MVVSEEVHITAISFLEPNSFSSEGKNKSSFLASNESPVPKFLEVIFWRVWCEGAGWGYRQVTKNINCKNNMIWSYHIRSNLGSRPNREDLASCKQHGHGDWRSCPLCGHCASLRLTLMQTMLHKYEEMQMRLKSQDEEDCGTGTGTTFFFYKNLNNSLSKINNKQKHNKKQNNKNNK